MQKDPNQRPDETIKFIQKWFEERDFTELKTPTLVSHFSLEENIHPFMTETRDHLGNKKRSYLRVSPEISLKKKLAEGYQKIYEIGPCYRNREPHDSPLHAHEFTMLEWYRKHVDYKTIMDDMQSMITQLFQKNKVSHHLDQPIHLSWERLTVNEAFKKYAELDLSSLNTWEELIPICAKKGCGSHPKVDDAYYSLFLNLVEPKIPKDHPVFLIDYPDFQASLAKRKIDMPHFAERFELYIAGIELANGFSELCESKEQRERMKKWQTWHREETGIHHAIDESFIDCLDQIGSAAGVALGFDRLNMILSNATSIHLSRTTGI